MTPTSYPSRLYEPGDVVIVHEAASTTLFGYHPEQWRCAVILKRGESRAFASGVFYDIWYLEGSNPAMGTTCDASYISGKMVTEQAERKRLSEVSA